MKPVRNGLQLAAVLAVSLLGVSTSGGCNSGCPVGTTNQGSTCKPVQSSSEGPVAVAGRPGPANGGAATSGSGGPVAGRGVDGAGRGSGNNPPTVSGSGGRGGRVSISTAGSTPDIGTAGVLGSAGSGGAESAGTGAAGEDGSANSGTSSTAGTGGGSGGPAGEPCSPEGAMRCAMDGEGAREACRNGFWDEDAPCPAEHTCAASASGEPSCQPLSAVCMAAGQPVVCDPQGVMLMCNDNGTAMKLAACRNAELCMAGLASGRCANCKPGAAMCNGKDLQRCSADGSAFQVESDCKSAPLCDQGRGVCKPPVCEAGSYTCNGDSLDQCKPDLTGYTSRRCQPGLCDARAKACLTCKPGATTCSGSTLMTCDAQGQGMDRGATCSGTTPICDAAMKACVECKAAGDCKTDNACAAPNGCSAGKCSFKPRYTAPSTAGNGATVRSGLMEPDPVYVVYGNTLFWVPNEAELNSYYGGFGPVVIKNATLTGYDRCPRAGTLIRERGDPQVYVSTGRELVWVSSPEYLAQCGWAINEAPTGSVHTREYIPPAGKCPVIE